jgi:hypothetical protein
MPTAMPTATMTAAEWMAANKGKYKTADELARACMQATGRTKNGRLYQRAREIMREQPPLAKPPARSPARRRRDLDELRDKLDLSYIIPKAIGAVIEKFILGGGWLYDREMLEEVCARVPKARSRWSQYRDDERWAKYQVGVEGKLIWVDPKNREDVERMRAT